jgi:hypothetical protein
MNIYDTFNDKRLYQQVSSIGGTIRRTESYRSWDNIFSILGIRNKFISWNEKEQVCVGLFDIVGTYNGTTYNKKYGGYIYTFDKSSAGILGNVGGFVSELN